MDSAGGCISPARVKEALGGHSERVLHLKEMKGLFCGYSAAKEASALDDAIASVFKQSDWCCHQNGSFPLLEHQKTSAAEDGTMDAGPRADDVSIGKAVEVWRLTNPELDKWQARIFGHRFGTDTPMAVHNHYKCQ